MCQPAWNKHKKISNLKLCLSKTKLSHHAVCFVTTTHLIGGNWQLRNCFWKCKEVTWDHWCLWAPAQPLGWPSVIQGTFPAAWKYACRRDMKAKSLMSLCQVYQFHNVKCLHPSLLDPVSITHQTQRQPVTTSECTLCIHVSRCQDRQNHIRIIEL